jgi:hypothetical protein
LRMLWARSASVGLMLVFIVVIPSGGWGPDPESRRWGVNPWPGSVVAADDAKAAADRLKDPQESLASQVK